MSSAIDEDTVRTVQSGRETLGEMLSAAQSNLQKVFIVFVVGMIGTILALQYGVWERLRADLLYSQMDLTTQQATSIVAVTPFDVILLQVKIGAVIGILMSVPLLVFFGRDGLRRRGWWPAEHVPAWKGALFVLVALGLFAVGVAYAYELFFPIMFQFLAGNALDAGFTPQYSIVKWFQFVFLLAVSFGLAAQLPLLMTVLSYTGIVPYETFREKWRIAVVAIFGFGALFSPPDPFTQIMWALPLCGLYGISLALSKLAVTVRRSGDLISTRRVAREQWNTVLGAAVVGGGAVYLLLTTAAFSALRAVDAAAAPYSDSLAGNLARPALLGLSTTETALAIGAVVGLVAAAGALYYHVLQALSESAVPAGRRHGDPTAIDIGELDAGAVRVAPEEAFEVMTEEAALGHADSALSAGDQEKAQAVLDRWDAVHEDGGPDAGADSVEGGAAAASDQSEDGGNVFASTTAGMADAFTEEETTEDDIGGYYYDIRFILDSLLSKAFWIMGLFGAVLAGVFIFLYSGGIGTIQRVFVSRLPEGMQSGVSIVTLHPVEHLVFIVKFSTIVGAVSVIPLVAYFAWPAMKDRGLVVGDRKILLVWGGSLFGALVVGSLVGFLYVAPVTISAIARDQLQANMIISYRISSFGWLVFFLTVGIGLLAEIPITMFLFHRGGIVPFSLMYERWREVVIGIVTLSAILSPQGIFTMFLVGIPVSLAYLFGLAILWVYTLGGRRTPKRQGEPAD
ncbi:twin-arginine translocase subunit TatC [Haloarcula onubensis]|uniref:Sec-independent protein translocase protein TatC n=1 Tax=Haloarcula onubensis TaxID=2950539 RepID=A0ABU2FNU8_9EURY|nr:twin-arginine translocase subunit TatC [Halomicroarcula sp. S3CR25-11]MDS0281856.1 twin-arginine translocase subunit TatC [Halomicroarcula sp. S3CR25-11]